MVRGAHKALRNSVWGWEPGSSLPDLDDDALLAAARAFTSATPGITVLKIVRTHNILSSAVFRPMYERNRRRVRGYKAYLYTRDIFQNADITYYGNGFGVLMRRQLAYGDAAVRRASNDYTPDHDAFDVMSYALADHPELETLPYATAAAVETVRGFADLVDAQCYPVAFQSGTLYVHMPLHATLDEENRPHRMDGPAFQSAIDDQLLKYRREQDAEGRPACDMDDARRIDRYFDCWMWRGKYAPPEIRDYLTGEKPLTAQVVDQEVNLENKTMLLEVMGLDSYLMDSDATEIDSYEDNMGYPVRLYAKSMTGKTRWGRQGSVDIKMLSMVNHTEEPDGSRKPYVICVPTDITDAKKAMAWSWGLDELPDVMQSS